MNSKFVTSYSVETYANAVMIGHGPHEFSFDFITNFYPHSAVSARVFLSAGQVPRLYESSKGPGNSCASKSRVAAARHPNPTRPATHPPPDRRPASSYDFPVRFRWVPSPV